jgi:aspartate/methionine/tyrosine aminotransferase
MQLRPFLLEQWLEGREQTVEFDLASSTGPKWTFGELAALMTDDERKALDATRLSYCPAQGNLSLREAIASMYGAAAEEVQIVTGASEALLAFFLDAAEPGANVVVPQPAFPPFLDIPEALGLETRRFTLRGEQEFRIDLEEIRRLTDERTKFILVNSPHNPTGSVLAEREIRELDELANERAIQLIVDEVYHPIYRDGDRRSAGEYTRASVLGDFSKAFSLSGLRVGWVLERNTERRKKLWNARAHFTISSSALGEFLAEVAVRHRERVLERAREVSGKNLALLDEMFRRHEDTISWTPPLGGFTGFPAFRDGRDSRPFCELASERSVLLDPGDCFGFPAHFRIGFGACSGEFERAVAILDELLAPRRAVLSG